MAHGGEALQAAVRASFEARFGWDFSQVRVHHDGRAESAAAAIGARAYTLGNEIAFARDEYRPASAKGARLLAHELAHVVQAANAPNARVIRPKRFADRSGGGQTDYEESVRQPRWENDTFTGLAVREEIFPPNATGPEVRRLRGVFPVSFDANACEVRVERALSFQSAATGGGCNDPPNNVSVPALTATQLASFGDAFVRTANLGLSNWFVARLTNCRTPTRCSNVHIPIQVRLCREGTPGCTRAWVDTVNVVNRAGRDDARTVCARKITGRTVVHEAGHIALGLGDEYREHDPQVIAQHPTSERPERIRNDNSLMGQGSRLRARHFRFAQVFLEAAFPDCKVELHPTRRASIAAW